MAGLLHARIARKFLLLSGVAASASLLSLPAFGQNIDTTPSWDGAQNLHYWGVGYNETFGQTITPTTGQTILNGFTFNLRQDLGTAQYQAFVYQWDAANARITGNALFTSAILTAPSGATFQPVVISTNGPVRLTAGQQYVLFLTTSTVSPQADSAYSWGALPGNTTYAGGQFVYNNGTDFGLLSTTSWGNVAWDLAFIALLTGKFFLSSSTPANPANVAAALNDYADRGGTIPIELLSLTGDELLAKLKQLSGEVGAGAQQSGIQLMNNFMSLLVDPFADTRNRSGMGGGASGYAPENKSKISAAAADAYAKVLKAAPAPVPPERRWSVWGSAYGGYSKIDGDGISLGTHDTTTRGWGFAVGADYRVSPDTVLGFALAGGGVSWSLAEGLGSGKGDAFQAGVYATHWMNKVYVSGALAGSWFDMSTDRTVTVVGTDVLIADFNASSWGGRLESGIRYGLFGIDTTPYAAVQVQRFSTDGYSENVKSGSNLFALSYGDKSETATRTELGVRFANDYWTDDGSNYAVFSKLAWAHDFNTGGALTPVFQSLGSSFIVNGAEAASDLALVQVGVEARTVSGWSLMAKLGGEFGGDTQTYTAQGKLGYAW